MLKDFNLLLFLLLVLYCHCRQEGRERGGRKRGEGGREGMKETERLRGIEQ